MSNTHTHSPKPNFEIWYEDGKYYRKMLVPSGDSAHWVIEEIKIIPVKKKENGKDKK